MIRTLLPTSRGVRWVAPAWLAVLLIFAFDGFVFGTWAARVPDISANVNASAAALGGALLCVSFGALATMQLAGRWCARYGGGAVASAAGLLLCVALVLPGLAATLPALAGALFIFGAATGAVNVSANSLGVRLEVSHRRSLMPMLHAGVSFGALAGAVLGGVASTALAVLPHLLLVAAGGLVLVIGTAKPLARVDPLPAAERRMAADLEPEQERSSVSQRGIVLLLGAIAGCTAFAEGTLTDWAALHLRTDLGAGPVAAAAGYAGFSLAMGSGRLVGGRAIRRFGETRLLVGGSLIAAGAMLCAALTSSTAVALVGFLVVGFGLANIFPIALASSGALAGSKGVALASTIGYSGLLGGPPLVGFVAEHLGLPVALTSVSLFAACVALATTGVRALARKKSLAVFPAEEGRPTTAFALKNFRFRDTVAALARGYSTDMDFLHQGLVGGSAERTRTA